MVLWLLVGIPALALGLTLFVGRSPVRTLLGYLVLALGFGVMAVFDRPSAAILGGVLALLYAAGRGGPMERDDRPDDVGVSRVAGEGTHGRAGAG